MEKLRPFVAIFQGHSLLTGYANLRADLLRAMAACDVNDSRVFMEQPPPVTPKWLKRYHQHQSLLTVDPKEVSRVRRRSVRGTHPSSRQGMHLAETQSCIKWEAGKGEKGAREETRKCQAVTSVLRIHVAAPRRMMLLCESQLLAKKAGVHPEIIIVTTESFTLMRRNRMRTGARSTSEDWCMVYFHF